MFVLKHISNLPVCVGCVLGLVISEYIKAMYEGNDFFYYLLGKGGYILGSIGFVCLFLCLCVSNITQKVMNGL